MIVAAHAHCTWVIARGAHRASGRRVELRIGHELEDMVQADGAYCRETINVPEVYLASEKQERAEEQTEYYGPKQVAVVHDVLIDSRHRIKHRQSLCQSPH